MKQFRKDNPFLFWSVAGISAFFAIGVGLQGLDAVGLIDLEQMEQEVDAREAERQAEREVRRAQQEAEEAARFRPIDRDEPSFVANQRSNYIWISPTNLYTAWNNNRVKAERNYNGILATTSGTVRSIVGNTIEISDGQSFHTLSCDFNDSEIENVSYLNHNGRVTVRGELVVEEAWGRNIRIRNCQVAPYRF